MELIEAVTSSSVRLMVPLLLAMLGELISERAGILNVGLEGMMTAGAFAGFIASVTLFNIPMAICIAALAGMVVASAMAAGTVWLKGNAILVGFSLFILVPGIANFLYIQGGWTEAAPAVPILRVPVLSDIPVIGSALFAHNAFYFLAVILTAAVWFLFARTRVGLVISAVGHDPRAAESKGVSARWVQTLALLTCGAFAGISGASLSLGAVGSYVPDIIGGRGFIVIAIVILGRWTVPGAVAGGFLLAVLDAIKLSLAQQPGVPVQLLGALPWVVVIAMLIISANMRSNAPRTLVH
ncbi:ABC transporter permease [Defluviimonas sp. SAOS-178_SWC]|uniref:ABC transporter permease n=1 Tax=Defluviimonas sp. SAOS-178_SWC TaxID=3121287 RepID=UPI003221A8A8